MYSVNDSMFVYIVKCSLANSHHCTELQVVFLL